MLNINFELDIDLEESYREKLLNVYGYDLNDSELVKEDLKEIFDYIHLNIYEKIKSKCGIKNDNFNKK